MTRENENFATNEKRKRFSARIAAIAQESWSFPKAPQK